MVTYMTSLISENGSIIFFNDIINWIYFSTDTSDFLKQTTILKQITILMPLNSGLEYCNSENKERGSIINNHSIHNKPSQPYLYSVPSNNIAKSIVTLMAS